MACEKCSANGDNVKHKQRESAEKKALLTRLSRIEGQVRGVRAMVEDDRYCVDIVTQVSSIQAALNGFNKELLARQSRPVFPKISKRVMSRLSMNSVNC